MGHKLKEINLSFYGFAHAYPNDVDMLLVAPNGRAFEIMSDAGGTVAANPIVFVIGDRGTGPIPTSTIADFAVYRPTNYSGSGTETFPAPAPAPPYGNGANAAPFTDALSSYFDGIDPNGDWKLYVVDDAGVDAGSITQWALNLTAYPEYDNVGAITLNDGAKSTPYPSQITVQDVAGIRTGAYVRFNGLSHSADADIDALLTNSNSGKFVIQSDAGGAGGVSGVTYTIDDSGAGAMPQATAFVDGSVYRPTDYASPAFPSPAPAGPYPFASPMGGGTFRSSFLGGSPNGAWNLYLNGGASGGSGTIAGGWTLGVTNVYDAVFVNSNEDTDTP
jgi:hypothetical protein